MGGGTYSAATYRAVTQSWSASVLMLLMKASHCLLDSSAGLEQAVALLYQPSS